MTKNYYIVGKIDSVSMEEPLDNILVFPIRFFKYIMDNEANICGAKVFIDLGHRYDFNYGEKEADLYLGKELRFEHNYTDTSDGTWDDDSYTVVARLIEK